MKTPILISLLLAVEMSFSLISSAQIKSNGTNPFDNYSLFSYKQIIIKNYDSSLTKTSDTSLVNKEDSSLLLKEKELNNIIITTKKKILDQNLDRIIYHVSNDKDASNSYIYDIIKKIPGIYADQNDQLVVNGSQNFLILINGRKSSLMSGNLRDILQSLPASNVIDIEVFQTPPPKFSTEGVSAVINLILNKQNIAGYNGSLNYQIGSPNSSTGNVSLQVKTGIVSYSTQNGLNYKINPSNTTDYILNNYFNNEKIIKSGKGRSSFNSKYTSHELVLEIDSINLLSLNFSTSKEGGKNTFINESNNFVLNGEILNSFKTQTNGFQLTQNHQWGLDFETSFSKTKNNLFTLSYQSLNMKDFSDAHFEVIPEINSIRSINNTNNNGLFRERTFQINYSDHLGTGALDFGAKIIRRNNESNYYYKSLDFVTNNFLIDPYSTDEFSYTQNIYSGYGNYDIRMNKSIFAIGGSIENVEVFGNYKTNGDNIYRQYLNLIPNISLSRKINNYNIKIGYAQKIERPSLYYLNPFVNKTDPFLISYGNPNLNPSVTHTITGSIGIFKSKYSLNLFLLHNITNNAILSYTFIGTDKITHSTYGNVGLKRNTMLNISANMPFSSNVRLSLNWSPSYIKYSSLIKENKITRSGLIQNLSGNFTWKLPLNWRLSGNLNYFSNSITVQGKGSSFVTTGVNLNKEIGKKKKFDVTFSILNPHQGKRKYFTENFDSNFYYYNESISVIRQIMVRLNYRFGGFQGSLSKKKKGIYNTDLKSVE